MKRLSIYMGIISPEIFRYRSEDNIYVEKEIKNTFKFFKKYSFFEKNVQKFKSSALPLKLRYEDSMFWNIFFSKKFENIIVLVLDLNWGLKIFFFV